MYLSHLNPFCSPLPRSNIDNKRQGASTSAKGEGDLRIGSGKRLLVKMRSHKWASSDGADVLQGEAIRTHTQF